LNNNNNNNNKLGSYWITVLNENIIIMTCLNQVINYGIDMNDGKETTNLYFPTNIRNKGTCFYVIPVISGDGF
jgi:hypothetical protein